MAITVCRSSNNTYVKCDTDNNTKVNIYDDDDDATNLATPPFWYNMVLNVQNIHNVERHSKESALQTLK